MRFGLALDFGTRDTRLDQHLAGLLPVLRLAEQAGFSTVVAGESYPSSPPYYHQPAPFLVLAGLASRTTLRLGTGVTLLPAWSPLKLAYECAVLDQLSGGRFTLGIGVANAVDWVRYGKDRQSGGPLMDETLRALKALWRGDAGFQGDFVQIEQAIVPRPIQAGGPPILVGGLVAPAIRRAATLADGWYSATPYRLTDIRNRVALYRETMAAAGKDPATGIVAVNRLTLVAADRTGLAAGAPYVTEVLQSYARRGGILAGTSPHASAEAIEAGAADLLEQAAPEICLIGTPDEVGDRVAEYAEAGVTEIQLRLAPAEMPVDLVLRTLTLVAERVLPRFP